jgi:hypothetical protein
MMVKVLHEAAEDLLHALRPSAQTWRAWTTLVGIACLCYFYALAHFQLSVDDEVAAFRVHPEQWLSQGRLVIYWVERLALPQPTLPFFPNLLFCVAAATAYPFVLRAHDMQAGFIHYLAFPLFCAFPTWTYLGEFYANFPSAGLGLLAVGLYAALFRRTTVARVLGEITEERWAVRWTTSTLLTLLIAVAFGCYQTFIFSVVATQLSVILFALINYDRLTTRGAYKMILEAACLTVAGSLLYLLMMRVHLWFLPQDRSYVSSLLQLRTLQDLPYEVLARLGRQILLIYGGAATFYGFRWTCLAAMVVVGLGALLCHRSWHGRPKRRLTAGLLAALIFTLPFASNLLAGGLIPPRSYVFVPYVVWLFALLAMSQQRALYRLLGCALVCITVFRSLYIVNLYAARMSIAQSHDRFLAAALYQRLAETHPNFDRDVLYRIAVYGYKSVGVSVYPEAHGSTAGASFFDWDRGNIHRMLHFWMLSGYDNLRWAGDEREEALLPLAKDMPTWPAKGSVRWAGESGVIKLGKI